MKGLRKYLTPFAPDQSGAVSMCYALGGMVVIVDAGGCAGNICGFDEPRWQPDYASSSHVGAVFSAGLRDMDAILGRDEALTAKVEEAARQIDASFIALVGTPVPAVIGTDLPSAARMAQKACHLPCIAIQTDGMHLYDRGIEEALLTLVKAFSGPGEGDGQGQRASTDRNVCSVLGWNPLDLFDPQWADAVRSFLLSSGYDEVLIPGADRGLEAFYQLRHAKRNYVVSPAGIAAARHLEKMYGIPYEVTFPADPGILMENNRHPCAEIPFPGDDLKVLVVHQQVLANAIRKSLAGSGFRGSITAATWFRLDPEFAKEGDIHLQEEDDFIELVQKGGFDLIIADPSLKPMAKQYQGAWIDAFHFAVSGQAAIDHRRNIIKG